MRVKLWLLAWTAGLVLGIFVLCLRLFKGLRVRNRKGLFHKGPTLIVANHPAIWETFVLPALSFPDYLLDPNRVPWSTPDKKNFTNKWYLAWVRHRRIPMARDNSRKLLEGINQVIETLQRGETVVLFAEGGRTRSIRPGETYLYSQQRGKRIRPLKQAALRRILSGVPGLTIVPVWVDRPDDNRTKMNGLPDRWRRMKVLVGSPIQPDQRADAEKLTHQLERTLLGLADQVD